MARHEQRVGGYRAVHIQPLRARLRDGRLDDALFFIAQMPAFSGVRIQTAHRDARRDPGPSIAAGRRDMMVSSCSSRGVLSASLTARSGRCVVASATRRSPATSIMTGSAARVRAAMYSVWPMKCEARLVDQALLHRRGDHGAEARRLRQPSTARSMSASTAAPLARSSWPGTLVAARGWCSTLSAPAAHSTGSPGPHPAAGFPVRAVARAARAWRGRQGRPGASCVRCAATARHRSGPMPAGSPEVSAIGAVGLRAVARRRIRRESVAATARSPLRRGCRAALRRRARAPRRPCCRSRGGRASARCASRTGCETAG